MNSTYDLSTWMSIDILVVLIAIFIMCWVGSLAKDFIIIFRGEDKRYIRMTFKFRIARITLSTITSTMLIFALSDFILNEIGFKGLLFVSLLSGVVGFELLERISTLNTIIELIDLIVFRRSADTRDYKDTIKPPDEPKVIIKKIYVKDDKDIEDDHDNKP